MDCSDDSWRDTFFRKHEHGALWLLICGAIEKHLLTYWPWEVTGPGVEGVVFKHMSAVSYWNKHTCSVACESVEIVRLIMWVVCFLILWRSSPSVLWRCWLGGRKGIRPDKNWVVGCWRGCLSGAMCRFAYGPADATAIHCVLLQ